MEENKTQNIDVNLKDFQFFDELSKIFENENENGEEIDAIKVLGSILSMSEESYEIIKPVLFESIERTFNNPEARIAFGQIIQSNGLTLEDFEGNIDTFIDAVNQLTTPDGQEIELTESKKDLLKFIYITLINAINEAKLIPNRVIQIPIELCAPEAKLPTYATDGSAAMDIYSPDEYVIEPGQTLLIPTGLKVNIPKGYALLIQPRSGLSLRSHLRIPNTPGLIDSDYHQEIKVIVENTDSILKDFDPNAKEYDYGKLYGASITIGRGERFAQMRLIEVPKVNWLEVESLGEFQDDHNEGFGSTGQK